MSQVKRDMEASGNSSHATLDGGDLIQTVNFQGGKRVASANGAIKERNTVSYREGSYSHNYIASNDQTKPDKYAGAKKNLAAKTTAELEKEISFSQGDSKSASAGDQKILAQSASVGQSKYSNHTTVNMEVLADKHNRHNVRVKFTEKGLNKSGELVRNIFTKKFPFDSEEVKSKTKMLN
jgi:hypothetical protein